VLDCTALDHEVCDRAHVTALEFPRRRHEAMAARATLETRSTWSALDRISVRPLLPVFERRRVLLQLRSIADVVRSSAPTGASLI
jgi:hypothetical protein